MSKFLFTNNAATTLASGISGAATSMTVASGGGALFPSPGSNHFNVTLIRASDNAFEIVKVTARTSDTFTIVRAQEGTLAIAFVTGDKVELRATAAGFGAMLQQDDLTAAIGVSVQGYDAATAKTNVAQQFTARQRTSPVTDNDLSFDLAAGNDFYCTPTAGGTLTFTNITAGCKGEILLVNNSNYAIAKAATVKCPSTMLTTISATGRYRLAYSSLDGTNVDVTSSSVLS